MEAYKEALRFKRYLEAVIYVELLRKKKHIPSLEIADDDESYTDHSKIHLGVGNSKATTRTELFYELFYILGHELQHIQSTTNKDWMACLKTSERDICEILAKKVLGRPMRLIKETDFNKFYDELYKNGVLINRNAVQMMIHFIMNSLEDGRIENIRDMKHPGFKKYRRLYRGKLWEENAITDENSSEYPKMKPDEVLQKIMNEILSLSTIELHSKGFLSKYGATPLEDTVASLIPDIRHGTHARTCRKGMEYARDIVNKLADNIIAASKANELEKLMYDIMKSIFESLEKSEFSDAGSEVEGDGEEGEESFECGSLFGASDLDDDEPKASSSKDKSSSKGKPDSSSSDDESEDGSSSEGESEDKKSETLDNDDLENSKPSASPEHDDTGDEYNGDVEALILKAEEEALKAADPNLAAAKEDAEKEKEFKDKMSSWSGVKSEPIDTSDIDDKYDYDVSFYENNRHYTPDVMLPFELENKGQSLKNKIKEILKNKRLPDSRGLRSGSIDGSLLHRLILSDTSVYKRRGDEVTPDIAGYILIDNSGSMGTGEGSTRHFACDAVSVIEEGFSDYMPLKIAAFDAEGYNSVTHEVVKEFDETSPANLTHNFCVKGRDGWGNKDGYSVRMAIKQLEARQEKEKLLIVTSDGIPTDYPGGYSEGVKDVRSAVEYARKRGIKVIGLFMYSSQSEDEIETFKEMYAPEFIICERDQIEDELVRVMKRAFTS